MDKKPLIGVSILAVFLLMIGSLSTVVGYQTVQSSNQSSIKERINQRELLFQIIVDIANNKEIQRIILKSQMSRGIFPPSEIPVVTKQQIRQMYFLGLIHSKVITTSRMYSMIQQHLLINPGMLVEIQAALKDNLTIKKKVIDIQNTKCDCGNEEIFREWKFPFRCAILYIFIFISVVIFKLLSPIFIGPIIDSFLVIIFAMLIYYGELGCPWSFPWGRDYAEVL